MERREFVGSMLALFTGVAMPEPVRELIVVPGEIDRVFWTDAVMEDVLKEVFCAPITAAFAAPQGELNKLFAGVVEHWDTGGDRYVETTHYFDLGG